tara:strand:+ start:5033 stop:6460 length:1428 start_codon:yes stop_codon:yes gene_type:complete
VKTLITTVLAASMMTAAGCAQLTPQTDDSWMTREAAGDLTQFGGARRMSGDISEALKASISNRQAKNVILLIGDGMGDSEITVARNYARGAGGFFAGLDALPLTGQYTHYSLHRDTHKPNYVTDSAASATAWATGVKSYNGAIGVDVNGKPHTSLLELAKQAGKGTGNVSTAAIQDATPAAQYAHISMRKCYGPHVTMLACGREALKNGGPGSISEQLLNTRPDISLGGGAMPFDEKAKAGEWEGKTLLQQAQERGFQVVSNAQQMAAVNLADQQQPVLGLFAPIHMPVRWKGPRASYHGNLEKPAVKCEVNEDRTADYPTLASMTEKAIDLLKDKPEGFFLQVEGASIDKQNHAANPCGQIGETVDLDEAVQVALAFAKEEGDTLVIVTADHAHSSQIVYPDAKAPGLTQGLITKDGSLMVVSYGNSETDSMGHTGTQLKIAAYGPHAANVVGLTDQTDLFFTIRDALGLAPAE